jgi:hypothetical protein
MTVFYITLNQRYYFALFDNTSAKLALQKLKTLFKNNKLWLFLSKFFALVIFCPVAMLFNYNAMPRKLL